MRAVRLPSLNPENPSVLVANAAVVIRSRSADRAENVETQRYEVNPKTAYPAVVSKLRRHGHPRRERLDRVQKRSITPLWHTAAGGGVDACASRTGCRS